MQGVSRAAGKLVKVCEWTGYPQVDRVVRLVMVWEKKAKKRWKEADGNSATDEDGTSTTHTHALQTEKTNRQSAGTSPECRWWTLTLS